MKFVYSIGFIISGILVIRMTYIDGKSKKANLTTSYVMHFGGYIGGVGFIIAGISMLVEAISGNELFNWELH